jgi:Phage tail tube protein
MAQRIAGVAFLKVNGNQYPLRGNLTVSPSPFERAMIAGQDYVHGYSELPRVPYIEGDFSTLQGLSIETIAAMVNVTVTAELANETTFVLREACCRAALEINAREGQYRVRFEGVQCDEILP